jgi:hypothetical protein
MEITREQFMEFFRRDDFQSLITPDDAKEIFLNVLPGSGDITQKLINELLSNYPVTNTNKNMKEIKPTYVTFEQAKKLKEKGFIGILCKSKYWDDSTKEVASDEDGEYRKANENESFLERPEQGVVIEWLRVNHGIWISVKVIKWDYEKDTIKFNYNICKLNPNNPSNIIDFEYNFNTPQEAISEAIDYVLEHLI